jgi:hypothetical protein
VEQLILHLWGDYIVQSHWMAQNKTKHWWPALAHAAMYSVFFGLLNPRLSAWFVIFATHFLIDRYRIARYVVWAKNHMGQKMPPLEECSTGYPSDVPAWLSVWLLIAADNTLHLAINYTALRWL